MRLRVFAHVNACLVIAAIVAPLVAAPPGSSRGEPQHQTLGELKRRWRPGDRIACLIPSILGVLGFHHHMIVFSAENVAHVGEHQDGKNYVTIEHYTRQSAALTQCVNLGPGRLGRGQTIERIRKWDTRRPVYFNLVLCNCIDWADYWLDGKRRDQRCPGYL